MNTKQDKQDKKERILNALNRIEEQNKSLKQTLDKIYQESDIKHELEFVSMCNKIQKTAREAIAETGYYKNLESFKRDLYAPHELEGDVSEFASSVTAVLDDIKDPKVARDYKLNLATPNKFSVEEEPITEAEREDFKRKFSREIGDVNYSKEEWREIVITYNDISNRLIFDEDIIAAAKNFMVGPVTAWNNKAVVAHTLRFPSFEALKQSVLDQAREKDMILYLTYETTHKTLGPAPDYEVVSEAPAFIWRGAFLDKE